MRALRRCSIAFLVFAMLGFALPVQAEPVSEDEQMEIDESGASGGTEVEDTANPEVVPMEDREDPDDLDLSGLEDIVITAQRRRETLQDVAVAITVHSGDEIQRLGITETHQLASYTPNLDIKPTFGVSNPVVTIRGVGLNDFTASSDPTVGVYVDEVFLSSTTMMSFQLFDLDRVEVLKGPQGTLYGRNSTGGAVNFVTRAPSEEFDTHARVDYGRFDDWRFEGAVGGALAENLNGRLSLFGRKQGSGQFTNRLTSERVGEVEQFSGRLALEWLASDTSSLTFRAHGALDRSDGWHYEHIGILDPNDLTSPCQAFLDGRLDPDNCVDIAGYSDSDGDPLKGDWNFAPTVDNDQFGASLTAVVDLDAFTLTSISGYEGFLRAQAEDADASPNRGLDIRYDNTIHQFSQEVRLSDSDSMLVDWVFGGFFSWDNVVGNPSQSFDTTDWLLTTTQTMVDQTTYATAAFLHSKWDLNEALYRLVSSSSLGGQWNLIGGIRYTYEKREFAGKTTDLNPYGTSCLLDLACNPGPGVVVLAETDDQIDDHDVSGQAGLEYEPPIDDLMLYFTFSRGFKSGGFNGGFAADPKELAPYGPETVLAYEGGVKYTFFDDRARINAAGFYYDYQDLQLLSVDSSGGLPTVRLTNASDARISGLDADFWYNPIDPLFLRGGLAYLDTELRGFVSSDGTDQSGNRLANAPKVTVNGLVRYDLPALEGLLASLQSDFAWTDKTFKEVTNKEILAQGGYWLVNAELTLTMEDAPWSFHVWGRNLSDSRYAMEGVDQTVLGQAFKIYGMPRTFGLGFEIEL